MFSPLPKQHRVLPSRAKGTSPVSLCLLTPNSQASPKRIFSSVPPICHSFMQQQQWQKQQPESIQVVFVAVQEAYRNCMCKKGTGTHVQMQVVPLQNMARMLYAQHRSCVHGITQRAADASGCCCRHAMLQPSNC